MAVGCETMDFGASAGLVPFPSSRCPDRYHGLRRGTAGKRANPRPPVSTKPHRILQAPSSPRRWTARSSTCSSAAASAAAPVGSGRLAGSGSDGVSNSDSNRSAAASHLAGYGCGRSQSGPPRHDPTGDAAAPAGGAGSDPSRVFAGEAPYSWEPRQHPGREPGSAPAGPSAPAEVSATREESGIDGSAGLDLAVQWGRLPPGDGFPLHDHVLAGGRRFPAAPRPTLEPGSGRGGPASSVDASGAALRSAARRARLRRPVVGRR